MAENQEQIDGGAAERFGEPARRRGLEWAEGSWRPAATVVAVGLAMLLMWHVVNGKHGLQVWQEQRAEDRQLRKEIADLEQENARLKDHVDRLKSDPNAIEHEAREQLHYAKPGEVIYTLPPEAATPAQPAAPPSKPSWTATILGAAHDAVSAVERLFGGGAKRPAQPKS